MNIAAIKLGKELKELRKRANVTQAELGKKLGYSSPQFISNYERGLCFPSISSMVKIADALSVSRQQVADLYIEFKKVEILERMGV